MFHFCSDEAYNGCRNSRNTNRITVRMKSGALFKFVKTEGVTFVSVLGTFIVADTATVDEFDAKAEIPKKIYLV
jgi:hypothetical protein